MVFFSATLYLRKGQLYGNFSALPRFRLQFHFAIQQYGPLLHAAQTHSFFPTGRGLAPLHIKAPAVVFDSKDNVWKCSR
jgi:hypothetical protein